MGMLRLNVREATHTVMLLLIEESSSTQPGSS
jgi:hypothetical protein